MSLGSADQTWLVHHLTAQLRRHTHTIPADELFRPTIVFAPHPDDESLGCGGTILRLTDAAVPVWLVVLTNGEASNRGRATATLAANRVREVQAAADRLGIRANAVHCLGFRDGALAEDHALATARVKDLLRTMQAEQVMLPYRNDRHPDHEATNRIVHTALTRLGQRPRVREYPVWLWHHWPWTYPSQARLRSRLSALARAPTGWWRLARDFRSRVEVSDLLPRKIAALACHKSQMVRPANEPDWITLPDIDDGRWLACFLRGFELFSTSEEPVAEWPGRPAGRG